MFAWIYCFFALLFKLYILLNFIDDPSHKNFYIFVLFINWCIFGPMWTLYLMMLLSGPVILDHRPTSETLLHEYNNACTRVVSQVPNLIVAKNYVEKTVVRCHGVYIHPECQRYVSLIKKYGHYLTNLFKYGTIWFTKTVFPDQIKQLNYPNDHVFMRQEIMEFNKIVRDIEILEQLHINLTQTRQQRAITDTHGDKIDVE